MFWKKTQITKEVRQMQVYTDPQIIEEILERGVNQIYPNKEKLESLLKSGRRLRIYTGADATGSQLHLGHSKNFILLEKLRRLGHEVIVLFGDFTAMIGDPTGKDSARIKLTKEQVNENLKTWQAQLSKIISFDDKKNPAKIVRNSEWLAKMNFSDVIELSSNFTVGQMIERDMFQKRIKESRPVYIHEFFYPLMQGYDSVYLNVDMEIGGNDQTFNMLTGRTLLEKLNNKEKYVISMSLLENPKTGKKLMSKSEGDYVALNDSADEMFGKIMALPDEVIGQMFRDVTYKKFAEVNVLNAQIAAGIIKPLEAKKELAREIIKIYHNELDAQNAQQNFEKTFSKGEVPKDILEVFISPGKKLVDVLLENKIIDSKSDWRRLVDQNAITNIEEDVKINDTEFIIEKAIIIRVGKKRFIKISI